MLMLSPEDVALLLANNTERQWVLTRLAALDQQDKEILTKAERTEHVDVSMFPDETRRLLTEFLKAPKRMLSHEDIRQDVMLLLPEEDFDDANGSALRQVIDRARKKLKAQPNFHYEITNIRGKGYQLISKKEIIMTSDPKKFGENLDYDGGRFRYTPDVCPNKHVCGNFPKNNNICPLCGFDCVPPRSDQSYGPPQNLVPTVE